MYVQKEPCRIINRFNNPGAAINQREGNAMQYVKGTSLLTVKELNRLQIRRIIYHKAPITRQQIADELGVSLPTVTTNVAKMLKDGLLVEYESDTAAPQGGRKPQWLDFNPEAFFALGVEYGPYDTRVCLSDLRGAIHGRKKMECCQVSYEKTVDQTAQCIRELLQETGVSQDKILGLGAGLPGFVDRERGVLRTGPYSSWMGRPLSSDLQKKLDLPVWVDNNVRMRTVWRDTFSGKRTPSIFLYLRVSNGIASPLKIKNDILEGNHATAGEIGHMVVLPDGPVCPACGRRGCLGAISSEKAILGQVQRTLNDPEIKTIEQVLQKQKSGNPDVCRIMEKAVYFLGLSAANIFNLLSPELICVDGYIFTEQANRERFVRVAHENLFGLSPEEAQIEFIPYDPYIGAYGGAACVVRRALLEQEMQ